MTIIKISKSPEIIFTAKTLLFLTSLFIFYLVSNYLYIRWTTFGDIQKLLSDTAERVASDLDYKGSWNTSLYVNDYQVLEDRPLYIITTDGFIIDRIKPISGFLDTSDFEFSSSFGQAQTITSPAGEEWRLYSKNVTDRKDVLGTVLVGYYQPEVVAVKTIDDQLESTVEVLLSEIKVNGSKIDISGVNLRKVNVKLAVEIEDKFNHVLLTAGGIPAFIDRSYVAIIAQNKYQTISDNKKDEPFLVYSKPILGSSGAPVAVIVSGYSLTQVNEYLTHLFVFSIVSATGAIGLMLLVITYLLRREFVEMAELIKRNVMRGIPIISRSQPIFDSKKSAIFFEAAMLKVPFATLQYDICSILFSTPSKRWEYDEILEKMGEDSSRVKANWRKIYDAARNLNEKGKKVFGANIILFESKTFKVNQQIPPQKLESN